MPKLVSETERYYLLGTTVQCSLKLKMQVI